MDEILISFLMPTRQFPNETITSLKSIINNASDTINYEVLMALDSDDEENIMLIPTIFELFSHTQCGKIKILITERYYYYGLHEYYNQLVKLSEGKLLMLWNNDAICLETNIFGKKTYWDITLKQDYKNMEPYINLLYPTEIYFKDNVRGSPHHISNCAFPILKRDCYDLLKDFSISPLNDAYLNNIGNFTINDKSTIKICRMMISHNSPMEGEVNHQENFYKASQIHYSEEVQKLTLMNREILEEHIRGILDEK
jgi:hypothetical protein